MYSELEQFAAIRSASIPIDERVDSLCRQLRQVNETLWVIEDEIRACDRRGDFGPRFVELARSVYRANDQRADLKRRINKLLGSPWTYEKQYQECEKETAGFSPGGCMVDYGPAAPKKRAFLVLGPESSGTRLLTRVLISAGCQGSSGHELEAAGC